MSKNTPAFPVVVPVGYEYDEHHDCDGMTLRDYFAAKAMQAIVAKMPCMQWTESDRQSNDIPRLIATGAYDYADAMLEARK